MISKKVTHYLYHYPMNIPLIRITTLWEQEKIKLICFKWFSMRTVYVDLETRQLLKSLDSSKTPEMHRKFELC